MYKKKSLKFIFLVLFLMLILLIFFKIFNKEKIKKLKIDKSEESSYSSNIISEVSFESKDIKGNSYTVNALEGEVDFSDNKIIYLKHYLLLSSGANIKDKISICKKCPFKETYKWEKIQ